MTKIAQAKPLDRLAVFAALLEKAPRKTLGRTALMKLVYFLQTLRGVPLGYSFGLYTYGPYDSQVLNDLDYAEALNVVQVAKIEHPGHYGYEIRTGPLAKKLGRLGSDFVGRHADDIAWVVNGFGRFNASDLELISTILFVDREWTRMHVRQATESLVEQVFTIKPHFSRDVIGARINALKSEKLLGSQGVGSRPASSAHKPR